MFHFTKEGIEEYYFVGDKQEEDDRVQIFSELPLLVEQRVCGDEISDLSYLASGHNLNLTSEDMADLQRQGIAVEEEITLSP